jgi:transposase
MKRIKFVGLDAHAETIAVAVAEQDGEVRTLGVIPNREESIRKMVKKLGPVEQLRFCYEGGQRGMLGAKCEVIAPTLVPVKSGERVKTDRRDALKLARNYRAGELTAVWVPGAAHEALRDLVRAREAAGKRCEALDIELHGVGKKGSPLPPDHDYAVSTREYQSDQPSQ